MNDEIHDRRNRPRFGMVYYEDLVSPEVQALRAPAFRLWVILTTYVNRERGWDISTIRLAADLGLVGTPDTNRREVRDRMATLVAAGLVEVDHHHASNGAQGWNTYTLLEPPSMRSTSTGGGGATSTGGGGATSTGPNRPPEQTTEQNEDQDLLPGKPGPTQPAAEPEAPRAQKPKPEPHPDIPVLYQVWRHHHPRAPGAPTPDARKALQRILVETGSAENAAVYVAWVAESTDEYAAQLRGEAPWPDGERIKRDDLESLARHVGKRLPQAQAWEERGRRAPPPKPPGGGSASGGLAPTNKQAAAAADRHERTRRMLAADAGLQTIDPILQLTGK